MSNLFSKSSPPHYPMFSPRDCRLSCKSMSRKFSCLFTVTKGIAFLCIWRNTRTLIFFKKEFIQPILYGAHYLLRYTSIRSYKMLLEDFPLPYLSLISKIIKEKSTLLNMLKLWRRMVKYLRISVSYLMKCIYKNVRSILEVNWLVPTRMEN